MEFSKIMNIGKSKRLVSTRNLQTSIWNKVQEMGCNKLSTGYYGLLMRSTWISITNSISTIPSIDEDR